MMKLMIKTEYGDRIFEPIVVSGSYDMLTCGIATGFYQYIYCTNENDINTVIQKLYEEGKATICVPASCVCHTEESARRCPVNSLFKNQI